KLQHFNYSLKKNYLGLKNVGQWQQYERELKTLIGKLPEGSAKAGFQARLDVCVSLLNAAAKVNHVEKSLDTNFHGIKNAETWSVYLKDGQDLLNKVDKELEGRKAELVERLAKAKTTVDGIIKKHNDDLAAATKLYDDAVKSKKLVDAEKALEAAKKLGTHSTSAELVKKCEALVKELGVVTSISGVKAVGAKKLEVKFSKAVDSAKAVVEVKKGAVKVNTSAVTYSADKTSATVELAGKLTKGDYTVSVSGIETAAITGTTSVEDEKVSKIEILSDKAVASLLPDGTKEVSLTVPYKVSNQYGEDVTKANDVTATSSFGTPETAPGTGLVTIKGVKPRLGDKGVLTLVHGTSATTVTATLDVVAPSSVAEISVTELYNKDGKTLTETTSTTKDAFYLLVDAKDQYGVAIKDPAKIKFGNDVKDVIINSSNTAIVLNPTKFETVSVNGKDRLAMRVSLADKAKAGESVITMISASTGKVSNFTVKVAEGLRAGTVNLSQPAIAVGKEKTLIPVEVIDKAGNQIKDANELNNKLNISYTNSTNANIEPQVIVKNGNTYIEVDNKSVTTNNAVAILTVTNNDDYKVSVLQVSLKKDAVATTVVGLKDVSSAAKLGTDIVIKPSNVVVEDQYGRVIVDGAKNLGQNVKIKADTTTGVASDVIDIATGTLATTEDSNTPLTIKGKKLGSEKVTLAIYDVVTENNNPKDVIRSASANTVEFRFTDGKEYKSYEVEKIGTIYDELGNDKSNSNVDKYNKTVKVYGVLDNGSKVLLKQGVDYAVSSTNAQMNTDVAEDGVLNVDNAYTYETGKTEVAVPVSVTINATGERITQDVTISKVAPKVVKIDVVEQGEGALVLAGKTVNQLSTANYTASGQFTFTSFDALADVVATDQYGVAVLIDGSGDALANGTSIAQRLTYSIVSGELAFSGNGTGSASVTEIPSGSAFNVLLNVGGIDATTIKITTTGEHSASVAQAAVNDEAAKLTNAMTFEVATADAADATKVTDAAVAKAQTIVSAGYTVTKVANGTIGTGVNTDKLTVTLKVSKNGYSANTSALTVTFTNK
ncbi:MAG: hypothetical protein RR838_10760, partial [Clostridium sp.]